MAAFNFFSFIPVESIFSQDVDGVFQKMIDAVYQETSQHLLEILHTKYKFIDHLKAMRRYLLLGQGDFIRYLMDLLEYVALVVFSLYGFILMVSKCRNRFIFHLI